jgi:hypothetical protein
MSEIQANETPRTVGEVVVKAYDAADLAVIPGWDRLEKEVKLRGARLFDPIDGQHYRNTITRQFSELQARQFDRGSTAGVEATHLALGTDNSTSADYSDTSLNSEAARLPVTDSTASGRQLELITFIDSTEANAVDTIREVGVSTGDTDDPDAELLNHSLIEPQPKSSKVAITVTVTFTFKK